MRLDKIIKLGTLINIIILSIVLVLILTTQSCYLINHAAPYNVYSGCPVNTPRYFFKQHRTRMTKYYRNNSYSRDNNLLKQYQHKIR